MILLLTAIFSIAAIVGLIFYLAKRAPQRTKRQQQRFQLLFIGFIGLFIFLGCNLSGLPAPTPTLAPPTLNPILIANTPVPELETDQTDGEQAKQSAPTTPVPNATPTPIPTPVPTPTTLPPIVIYDEALHPDWDLTESSVEYDPFYSDEAYSGVYSLQMSPRRPRQVLWFTLKDTAPEPYLHDEVIGVTFRLYSGDGFIRLSDLAVATIGSNKLPYWIPNDDSVIGLDPTWTPDDFSVTALYDYSFSPSRLYFLGLSSDIPPDTWVWVTDLYENRTNDIDFKYITGFYIRNDDSFRRPVLIDDLQFIRAPKVEP